MTSPSRTTDQSPASVNIANGNISFRVLHGTPWREDRHKYLVIVPKALMRSGLTGWVSQAPLATSGKPTAFGADLLDTLRRMNGVEAGLDNADPHLLTLFVDISLGSPPEAAYYNEMPEPVVLAIEAAVLRNNGVGQRLAEYLRRI